MKTLFRFLDAFIHPARRPQNDPDALRRLRLIAGVSVALLAQIAFFSACMPPMPLASAACFAFITVCVLAVLLRLRLSAAPRGAGTVLWLSILVVATYSGLHQDAHWAFMSPLLGLIVLVALMLDGWRSASAAAASSVALIIGITVVHARGWQLPPLMPGSDSLMLTAANACISLVGLTYLAWFSHTARQRAYDELTDALQRVKESEAARARAEEELRLAHKLEAVGRLAAGVAHEINTPVQYVNDSMTFIEESFAQLSSVLAAYRRAEDELRPALRDALARRRADADLDYVLEEGPPALARAKEGLGRIGRIVRSMRDFAHPDGAEPQPVDLNRSIESTLNIATAEYKLVADVDLQLGELPPVRCMAGELNQVILNLVVNAAHAIADRYRGTPLRGLITVKSWREHDRVVIAVGDDGGGIPEDIRSRIFDPFFTTKELGRGTGQGLALARSIVVNKHHGALTFDTELGRGTTFFVRLPVDGDASQPAGHRLAA